MEASIYIRNKNNIWIDDNMVTTCNNCGVTFGFFVRKHHCRCCGNIFCYDCCNKYIAIPEYITDRPSPEDYWNVSYYIASLKGSKERTCDYCYNTIVRRNKIYNDISVIFENGDDMLKIRDMNLSNEVISHYFEYLRNIQYYLPNHNYVATECRILYNNAPYLSNHSKYIVNLIKSINWNCDDNLRYDHIKLTTGVLNSKKKIDCHDIYCTRTCQGQLSCDDCINILYSCSQHLPSQILEYLFNIISNSPDTVIQCHLLFLVNLITKCHDKNRDVIHTRIYQISSRTKKLTYHIYWLITYFKYQTTDNELANIKLFLDRFQCDDIKQMHNGYLFFEGIIKNIGIIERYLSQELDQFKPIYLPYDPEYFIVKAYADSITVKDSHTRPTIVKFQVSNGMDTKDIRLLFKKESVINDITVVNLMTLSDIILNEYMDPNFNVVVYPIMPIAPEAGMIQIVGDASTLYDIANNNKTILQYIMENNENNVISEVLDRYMYSLVAYTLHSYFIGLGDRHMQNIMMTNDGKIFHIDFGFILGTDAYPISDTDIKLNSEMIDVIGGFNGTRYKRYLDLCASGTIYLRKYFNMYFVILMQYSTYKESHIEKFVMSRFQPRQPDSVIVEEILSIIKKSNNAYSSYIRDFLHYHSQEKTLQHSISRAIQIAIGSITNY